MIEHRNVFNEVEQSLAAREQEAAQKRKLEEEADALFARALNPTVNNSDQRHDRPHRKNRKYSRSRSISAKRISESPPRRRAEWKRQDKGALTGSRAILMNKDFVEDLPHMPRPSQGGTRGVGGGSRSRSRRRRR